MVTAAPVRVRPRHGGRRGAPGRSCRPTTRATCSASSPPTAARSACSARRRRAGRGCRRWPRATSSAGCRGATDDRSIVLGVSDQPGRQLQALAHFRPDTDGGLLILGTGGSGKTVALRSVAISAGLAAEASGQPVEVHALDFAGRGLDILEELPHVGSVIAGDDTERVTRLLRTLRERIDQRADRLRRRAGLVAARVPPQRARRRVDEPGLRAARQLRRVPGDPRAHRGRPLARPVHPPRRRRAPGRRALRDHGRPPVVGADVARQLAAPPARAAPGQRRRVRQRRRAGRHPVAEEPAGAGDHGRHRGADRRARRLGQRRAPGRRDRPAGGPAAGRRRAPRRRPSACCPTSCAGPSLDAPVSAERLVFAIGDADLRPRGIPLDQGHVLVTGPPRSGKTTALATIAQSAALAGIPLFHVHVRPTPLAHAPFWGKVAQGADRRGPRCWSRSPASPSASGGGRWSSSTTSASCATPRPTRR